MEPRTRMNLIGSVFLSFVGKLANKFRRKLLEIAMKTVINNLKTATKKVARKAPEAAEQFIGNKNTLQIVKSKPVSDENSMNVEETIIPPEQKEETLKKLKQQL